MATIATIQLNKSEKGTMVMTPRTHKFTAKA